MCWRSMPNTARRIVASVVLYQDATVDFVYDGPDLDLAKADGFQGYHGFPLERRLPRGPYLSQFTNRIPGRNRPDFDELLGAWGIAPGASDLEILARTFGKLPTDSFEFIPEIEPVRGIAYYSDIVGFQRADHSQALREISLGTVLDLVQEPENPVDATALKVMHSGLHVGYIKRVHCASIVEATESGIQVTATLDRVVKNGSIKEAILVIRYL